MFPAAAGYDRAITVFSPDGRLYQVEYAIETVRRGSLALGLKSPEGVLLAVEERATKLQTRGGTRKLFQVEDHLGAAAAGYIPDARIQVDQARFIAQSNRLVYDEIIDVEAVARRIADLAQQFTQYAGVRPFGVSLIIGGVDRTGPELYQTDPSGTYESFDASAIGAGSDQVREYLEQKYQAEGTLNDAGVLAVESIYLVSEQKSGTSHIRMAIIDAKTRQLRFVPDEEIQGYAAKAKPPASKPS